MDIELPFKCNLEDFKKIYQEEYIGKISHEFIRRGLKLPDSVRVKLNGGFERWLYLIDEKDCLFKFRYRIQTALWFTDESGKGKYVSIFPNFIRRWCQPCLNLLEHISCKVGKGEDVFKHIDDPEELVPCEDRIAGAAGRLEKHCLKIRCEALLNSRYTEVFNRPISAMGYELVNTKRFPFLYSLVVTAKHFFGVDNGVLACVNTIIRL
jgi:hypothetical protein